MKKKIDLGILGRLIMIIGLGLFLYFEIFIVETLSDLAFLLIGLASGLIFCFGIFLIELKGGKK